MSERKQKCGDVQSQIESWEEIEATRKGIKSIFTNLRTHYRRMARFTLVMGILSFIAAIYFYKYNYVPTGHGLFFTTALTIIVTFYFIAKEENVSELLDLYNEFGEQLFGLEIYQARLKRYKSRVEKLQNVNRKL